MKQKVFKVLVFSIFILGIIISCQKEISEKQEDSTTEIIAAQKWYDSNYSKGIILNSNDLAKGNMQVRPDWREAFSTNHSGYKTVEVPIMTIGRFGYATKESKLDFDETGDARFLQSLTRLVVLSKEGISKPIGFLMTIIPDKDYQEANRNYTFTSSYKRWLNGFSGFIIYNNLDGSFSNGWKISDGKVVKTVNQKKIVNTEIKPIFGSKSLTDMLVCYNTYLLMWYQDCIEWYTNGVYVNTTCGPGYLVMELQYSICNYVEEGGGGGEGEGGGYTGGGSNSQSDPYTFQAGDKFSKPNLSTQIPSQILNTCVTSMLEYVNHQFCGGSINEGVYITDYLDTYGGFVFTEGVSTININGFIQRHFNTEEFNSFTNAIDSGYIVMADTYSDILNSTHNVAVLGYHPDGKLIYMDPATGSLREAVASELGLNYKISIKSCK